MNFKHFSEEMEPCNCFKDEMNLCYYAQINGVSIEYNIELNEFQIYAMGKLLLDMADLRAAKAFVRLQQLNGENDV